MGVIRLLNGPQVAAFVNSDTARQHEDHLMDPNGVAIHRGKTMLECGASEGIFGFPLIIIIPKLYTLTWFPTSPQEVDIAATQVQTKPIGEDTGKISGTVDSTFYLTVGPNVSQLFQGVPDIANYNDLAEKCKIKNKSGKEFEGTRFESLLHSAFEETIRGAIRSAVALEFTYRGKNDDLDKNTAKLEEMVFEKLHEPGSVLVKGGVISDVWPNYLGPSVLSNNFVVETIDWPEDVKKAENQPIIAQREATADIIKRKAAGTGDKQALEELISTGVSKEQALMSTTLRQVSNATVINVGSSGIPITLTTTPPKTP